MAVAVLGLSLSLLAGCARRPPSLEPAAAQVGVYRGRLAEHGHRPRRFRVILFARAPDRVHAEVVSPLGSTELIVDGGGGRLAVTFVDERVTYVGTADPDSLAKILGVRLALDELVRGLLEGASGDGYAVVRDAAGPVALPTFVEFRTDSATLSLELKRLKPLRTPAHSLGTGQAPDGTRVRELAALGQGRRVGEADESKER